MAAVQSSPSANPLAASHNITELSPVLIADGSSPSIPPFFHNESGADGKWEGDPPLSTAPSFISISSGSDEEDPNNGLFAHREELLTSPHVSSISGQGDGVPEVQLCDEQREVVDLILAGHNVFYTGSAGCGKSTVLKEAVRRLRNMGKNVQIVAPTGRAALQIEGTTTWTYMGWTVDDQKLDLEKLVTRCFQKKTRARIRETEVLVIDEISMVENHHFERMNHCLKQVRAWQQEDAPAFGGVQLIVTGDFCQLPPVKPFQYCFECGEEMIADEDEAEFNCEKNHGPFQEESKWAFDSAAWKEANFVHRNLKQIHRQSDKTFIKLLQKCRLGLSFSQPEMNILMNHPCKVDEATQLQCRRMEVERVNRSKFERLRTEPILPYKAEDHFQWNEELHPLLEDYQRRCRDGTLEKCRDHRLETDVVLRQDMLVVLLVNLDLGAGLCNGSQGVICGFEECGEQKLAASKNDPHGSLKEKQINNFARKNGRKPWPVVRFTDNKGHTRHRTIYATCLISSMGNDEPYSLLMRTQIPLTAGWAMTIHKSQGMTLNRVIVNLSRAFAEGQIYVALSRATSLDGLKIDYAWGSLSSGNWANKRVQQFMAEHFGGGLLLDDDPPTNSHEDMSYGFTPTDEDFFDSFFVTDDGAIIER